MDLINDLGNDLAVAFLVERQYRQKLDSRAAVDLIDRIEAALQRVARDDRDSGQKFTPSRLSTSH